MPNKKLFGMHEGKEVYLYELKGDGVEVDIIELGAIIRDVRVKVRGEYRSVVIGFSSVEKYVKERGYYGATVGRVPNRIGEGKFSLNGVEYILDRNSGTNCLHGGFNGYDRRLFRSEITGDNEVTMYLQSPDGDQGFPGALDMEVVYRLEKGVLTVVYRAVSDKDTYWCPTNHSYFNFSGNAEPVYDTVLTINAEGYVPVNDKLLPLGNIASVEGTAFDFRVGKRIGDGIHNGEEQQVIVGGYDHTFVLCGEEAAVAQGYGVTMRLKTDLPGVQLYTGNFLQGTEAGGKSYGKQAAFCLEPQFFPNAVNVEGFAKPLLKAGEQKQYYVSYEFRGEDE